MYDDHTDDYDKEVNLAVASLTETQREAFFALTDVHGATKSARCTLTLAHSLTH